MFHPIDLAAPSGHARIHGFACAAEANGMARDGASARKTPRTA